jgi:putative ABC transport system permease protein
MADRRAVFFVTYVRRELRRRMRQAVFIALGLALGVGLVVTVAATSAGVTKAQSGVLGALYGVGTDVTVTGAVHRPPASGPPKDAQTIERRHDGTPELCSDGKCVSVAGKTIDSLNTPYAGIGMAKVAEVTRLDDVAAGAGGLRLQDTSITFPKGPDGASGAQPSSFTLDGVDTGKPLLGPLRAASLTSGHSFTAAEADSDVAVLDSGYATSENLTVGSVLTIGNVKFTVIGIVRQPQASTPPDVYIPLPQAQDLALQQGSLKNEVNTIYVTAASASDISAVT